jgi:hypothetical protein
MTGAGRRRKGHDFERAVASAIRRRWPHLVVRRSQQGHKAFEPDVVVEGVNLWTECFIGAKPNPLAKLEQAERDTERFTETMLPVVVWRKSGERTTWATMRVVVLMESLGERCRQVAFDTWVPDIVVTVDFGEWLANVDLPETRAKEAA